MSNPEMEYEKNGICSSWGVPIKKVNNTIQHTLDNVICIVRS